LGGNGFVAETIIPKALKGSQLSFKFTLPIYIKGVVLHEKNENI
jgi:hypothetical protein